MLITDHFPVLQFDYINHKGILNTRHVVVPTIFWGNSEFYKEPQWMLNAFDMDKKAWRTFAVKNILGNLGQVIHVEDKPNG